MRIRRQPGKIGQTTIYITPDGAHAIAGDVVSFGPQPFEATRQLLQQRADGPARGAAGKQLEIVEFTDLQCPACKTAQSTIDQLVQDFPQAKLVVEDMPLTAVHPQAFQAAAVGQCVRKAKGDAAYFAYARKVYDTQADLTKEKADATLRAAVTAAGADPATVMTCASSPAAQDAVNAVMKLGTDIGVTNEPTHCGEWTSHSTDPGAVRGPAAGGGLPGIAGRHHGAAAAVAEVAEVAPRLLRRRDADGIRRAGAQCAAGDGM